MRKELPGEPLEKGKFFYLSKNGTGARALLETLAEHYEKLTLLYEGKGMELEAEVFAGVVEDLKALEQEIRELPTQPDL